MTLLSDLTIILLGPLINLTINFKLIFIYDSTVNGINCINCGRMKCSNETQINNVNDVLMKVIME